jgi:hypothetical protein
LCMHLVHALVACNLETVVPYADNNKEGT